MEISHNTTSKQHQTELRLRFYGTEQCESLHNWGPGLRDLYIIHFIHSGHGQFSTGGTTYLLGPGQGFVIIPNMLVHYTADEHDPWTYSWIGFEGLHARAFLQRAGLSVSSPTFNTGSPFQGEPGAVVNRSWFDDTYSLFLEAHSSPAADALHQSLLYRYMAELIQRPQLSGVQEARQNSSKETYIQEASVYIENRYIQKITVADIAQSVGLDSTYLSGLFKQQLGVSLQTFLLQYRVNRAAELLANHNLTISDIARSVGYTGPFLFSKMFKKNDRLLSPRLSGLVTSHCRNKNKRKIRDNHISVLPFKCTFTFQ
ncbi:AraC family ligand binding domain-containing protein [Paenibacillus sp. PR3]|uniref:AraC family ligand binding domain-containing protein n=1 Tax=Paenibacillus terricola TaxID=2763503 RepID=A0ABR8N229_9BACL|nr:AraC family transcriptional regulator [Paenibacillus terricola]MBD3922238.1 AraC family ligand binding domain-containing protein [Paenibacillus terricola]